MLRMTARASGEFVCKVKLLFQRDTSNPDHAFRYRKVAPLYFIDIDISHIVCSLPSPKMSSQRGESISRKIGRLPSTPNSHTNPSRPAPGGRSDRKYSSTYRRKKKPRGHNPKAPNTRFPYCILSTGVLGRCSRISVVL